MDIHGFPNYLIYPDGRVFNKKRNMFLKPLDNGTGYKYITLPDRKNHTIHRLVAIHYIPNPDNKPEVDHINRKRDDNRFENLRWATRAENNKNKCIQKRNNTGFMWITNYKTRGTHIYSFQRKINGSNIRKSSVSLPKLICYSFFYVMKEVQSSIADQ